MNALNNYAPILQAGDKLVDKYPDGKGGGLPGGLDRSLGFIWGIPLGVD